MKNRKPATSKFASDNSLTPMSDNIQLYSSMDSGDYELPSHDSIELVSKQGIKKIDDTIIDVVKLGKITVRLRKTGDIELIDAEGNLEVRESNNYIHKLAVYNNSLYGMGRDRKLYNYMSGKWKLVRWSPDNIYHISSSINEQYLWIQTHKLGFLYSEGKIVEESFVSKFSHRNYGYSNDEYVVIEDRKATYYRRGKIIETYDDVCDALVTYHHEVITSKDCKLSYLGWEIVSLEKASLTVA
jgi:hypothetical protein